MDSYSLMFCVVRIFMVFSGLGLKSPASEFQFYSTNSLKISQKYGTLHEFACHPCAGAMLIFSVSFQF